MTEVLDVLGYSWEIAEKRLIKAEIQYQCEETVSPKGASLEGELRVVRQSVQEGFAHLILCRC